MTRKKHQKRTEVYLAYMRVAFGVSDAVRRKIAQFLLGAEKTIASIPQPRKNVANIVELTVKC